MSRNQDGADSYGAYSQGGHIGGVLRERRMGTNQLAEARKLQARDGTAATAMGAGGLSSRPAESTGRKAVSEALDREKSAAPMRAAQAGAARAAAELGVPVSRPAPKPEQAVRPPLEPKKGTFYEAAKRSAEALKAQRKKRARQDMNFSRQRVAMEREGYTDRMPNLKKLREEARNEGLLDDTAA